MAKAKSKATDPISGFDGLNDDDRAWLKDYEDKGWLVRVDDEGWYAEKDEEALGPFGSFIAMMNTVEKAQNAEDGIVPVETDIKGNVYLPGAEPLSVGYLDSLTQRRINLVREFKTARQAVGEINQDILNAFNDDRYRKHFVLDNATGKHEYKAAGGGGLRINHKTVDKVESFDDDPDE